MTCESSILLFHGSGGNWSLPPEPGKEHSYKPCSPLFHLPFLTVCLIVRHQNHAQATRYKVTAPQRKPTMNFVLRTKSNIRPHLHLFHQPQRFLRPVDVPLNFVKRRKDRRLLRWIATVIGVHE